MRLEDRRRYKRGKFHNRIAEVKMEKIPANEYEEAFDPTDYFDRYYSGNPPLAQHMLRCYHTALQQVQGTVKVLDYGAGPLMLSCISSAAKASEIVLSDYTKGNRKALGQWLNGDSAAFDWTPHFRYVVQELEGKGEEEVDERQKMVRKLVKAVVHCDITQDPPITPGYDQPYDVVITSLVMEGAATNSEEYLANITRLGKLVKPGGIILYYGVENKQGYYQIGDHHFPNFYATAEFALKGFRDAGFDDLSVELFETSHTVTNRVFRFIKGTRKH